MECLVCFNENSSPSNSSHQIILCNYFCNLFSLDKSQFLHDLQEASICSSCFDKLDGLYLLIRQVKKIQLELKSLLFESQKQSLSTFNIYNEDVCVKTELANYSLRNRICDEVSKIDDDFMNDSYIHIKYIESEVHSAHPDNGEFTPYPNPLTSSCWNDAIDDDRGSQSFTDDEGDFLDDEFVNKSKSLETLRNEALTNKPIIKVKKLEEMTKIELMGFKSSVKSLNKSNQVINQIISTPPKKTKRRRKKSIISKKKKSKVPKPIIYTVSQNWKCDLCSYQIRDEVCFKAHMKKVHEGISKCFECPDCEKSYATRENFNNHRKQFHTGEGVPRHYCDQCENSYAQKQQLLYHIESKHSTQKDTTVCHFCNKDILTRHIKTHLRLHMNRNKYTCNVCGKAFTQNSQLEKHALKHMIEVEPGEKPFPCDQCQSSFTELSYLDYHIKLRHAEEQEKKQECDKCDFKTVYKAALIYHQRKFHTDPNDLPYVCNWENCERRFLRKAFLTVHIKKNHLNERPEICSICSKSFQSKRRLREHSLIHSNEFPFVCEICGRKFQGINFLKLHVHWHKRCEMKGNTNPVRRPRKSKNLVNEQFT